MDVVVAVDINWGIGKDGTQPVVISEDRRHFRKITGNGTVIVGRKTLEDFPGGKPLKNRKNVVLTSNMDLNIDGACMAHSLKEALELTKDDKNVFVIGGESVYSQFLPYCERAYVTMIYAEPQVDAHFPNLNSVGMWDIEDFGEEKVTEDGIKYRFMVYRNMDVRRAEL